MDFDSLLRLDPHAHENCNTVEQATAILCAKGVISPGAPITGTSLAHALLVTTLALPEKPTPTDTQALRAIAVLLAKEDTNTLTAMVANRIEAAIDSIKEGAETYLKGVADTAIGALGETMRAVDTSALEIQHKVLDMRQGVTKLQSCAESLATQAQASFPALSTGPHASPPPPPSWPAPPPSQSQTAPPNTGDNGASFLAEARAKAEADARYILIDLRGEAAVAAAKLTEEELIERAQRAFDAMGMLASDRPDQEMFRTVRKLDHGGLRFQTVSIAGAEWLRREDARKAFLDSFGGNGVFKERVYSVIAEYVPTTFNVAPGGEGARELEERNGLAPGAVSEMRWLKNPNSRHAGQQTAFLEVVCTGAEPANVLIGGGAAIDGRSIRCRKKKTEPTRCMKCQRLTAGHKASTCRSIHEVCARCGGHHRTDSCTSTAEPHCVNCAKDGSPAGHMASDRSCPTYLKAVERMRRVHPENRFRFYTVIDKPETWVLCDEVPMADPNRWYGAQHRINFTKAKAPRRKEAATGSNSTQKGADARGRTWGAAPPPPRSRSASRLRQTTLDETTSKTGSRVTTPTPPDHDA